MAYEKFSIRDDSENFHINQLKQNLNLSYQANIILKEDEKNSRKKINEMLYDESCMATSCTGFAIFTKIREKVLKLGGICGIIVNGLF